jgi:hypothetical protein
MEAGEPQIIGEATIEAGSTKAESSITVMLDPNSGREHVPTCISGPLTLGD